MYTYTRINLLYTKQKKTTPFGSIPENYKIAIFCLSTAQIVVITALKLKTSQTYE